MRARLIVLLAVLVAATAPAAAMASPAVHKPVKKPVKVPAFHAQLARTSERLTVPASIETFSTKGSRLPKGDRLASWLVRFGDSQKKLTGGAKLPKTFAHPVTHVGKAWVTLTLVDVHGKATSTKLVYSATGRYAKPHPTVSLAVKGGGTADAALPFVLTPGTWGGLPATATIDFGDGSVVSLATGRNETPTVLHTYTTSGLHKIYTTVVDRRGGRALRTDQLTLGSALKLSFRSLAFPAGPPVVGAPWFTSVGSSNFLSGRISGVACTTPETSITVNQARFTATATWATAGPKVVTCTFLDARGVQHTDSTTVTVVGPSITLRGGPTTTQFSYGVSFSITTSLGPRTISSWTLDPGNGAPPQQGSGTPSFPHYHYGTQGTYTATLTVTLDDGEALSASASVDVADAPEVDVSPDVVTASVNQPFTITGIQGFLSGNATWAKTTVYYGTAETQPDQTYTGSVPSSVSWTYTTPGTHYAAIYVLDDHGGEDYFNVEVDVS